MSYSLNQLYKAVGISKQAVYQYACKQAVFNQKVEQLLMEADELRREHPGCGVEKMYYILKPDFIGRDRFIELFMQLGYRLHIKKNYSRTKIVRFWFNLLIFIDKIILSLNFLYISIVKKQDIF